MELKKIIPPAKPEAPEWAPSPTPEAPHLWKNRKTGLLENRCPDPAPKITHAPYMGPPVVVTEVYEDDCAFLDHTYLDTKQSPELLTMDSSEAMRWMVERMEKVRMADYFMPGDSV